MPLNHSELCEKLFDGNIRLESIVHLASMAYDYSFPTPAEEAFDFDTDEVWAALELEGPEICDDREATFHILHRAGKLGFLIKAATPVPHNVRDGGKSFTHNGWGYYQTRWFYVEDFAAVFPLAQEWQKSVVASVLEKESKAADDQ